MLHLNIDSENADLTAGLSGEEIIWKVLVLDSKSTAIISSVLRVNDLLKSGVTSHALINTSRSPLPDVPAIYFVEPTSQNIKRISQDIKNDMYSSFYINFTSSLSRDLLEELAKSVAITGKSSKVLQVYDQYLNYIVTEPRLFSLELQHVYSSFNDAKTTEDEINKIADRVSDGLFDAIITIGTIPIIRAQKGGSAQLVAEKLDAKLRDYVISTKLTSSPDYSSRSVLILLDRNVDLAAMFSHSWIYQCLVADVFKLERNTITIESEEDGKKKVQRHDIEPKDFFWANNAQLPFPDAVDNADTELKNYKEKAAELTQGHASQNLDDLDGKPDDRLQQTVNQLPELTARKAVIDMHMNVLLALLNQLKAKGLDNFFEIEQSLNDPKSRQRFLEVLESDGNSTNLEDKLRTYIVLYLTTDLPQAFTKQAEDIFAKHEGFNTDALKFIKRVKETLRMKESAIVLNSYAKDITTSHPQGNTSALFGNLSSKLYNLTDGRITEGVGSLISGIKKLLPEKKNMPITNVVETIMDPNNSSEDRLKVTDDYLYFDPRKVRGSHSKQPKRQSYSDALVFIIGGGNYLEYQNLQEWANTGSTGTNKTVAYGSTSIYSPSEFLKEVSSIN